MGRWLAAGILASVMAPVMQAEPDPGAKAIAEAMEGFYVIVVTDKETGAPVAEVLRNEDSTKTLAVVVAYLDAADAAGEIKAAGLADTAEGKLVNAADLLDMTSGEVIWRTSQANSSLVNGERHTPPVFYITNADGNPMTKPIDGEPKVVAFVDAQAADSARVAAQNTLSAAGKAENLSVVAGQLQGLIGAIRAGKVKDLYFASAPSVVRWGKQWDEGKRLIRDYKPE